MKNVITMLLLLFSVTVLALDVDISLKSDGSDNLKITGTTNLPDGIALMATLTRPESAYAAQAQTVVKNGIFEIEPFSKGDSGLELGEYTIEISMPIASLQPKETLPIIGNSGENLRGSLIKKNVFGENAVNFKSKVIVEKIAHKENLDYEQFRNKFSEIGLCMACADNIAQYYTKKPDSQCGKLAKQALEGNPSAIKEIKASPSYCVWDYEKNSNVENTQEEKDKITTTKQEGHVYELMRQAAAYPVTDVSACIGGVKIAASTYGDLLRQGALQSDEYTKFSIQNQFRFAFENGTPVDKNAFWIMFEMLRVNNASWAEVSENGGNDYSQQVALWEAITCKFNSSYAGISKRGPLQKDAVVKLVDLLISDPKKEK